MHKYVKLTIASAALIGAAFVGTAAYAKTPAAVQPVVVAEAAPINFGGPEVGFDLDVLHLDNTAVGTKTKFDFGYNGRVGYGVQTSQNYFYGVEALDGTNSGVTRNYGSKDSVGNNFAADLRSGKVVSNTLLYGKVGYALTQVTDKNISDGVSNEASFSGVRAGAGIERFLMPRITGRAEVVYTDYQSRTLGSNTVDPSNAKATVGLSYKLN